MRNDDVECGADMWRCGVLQDGVLLHALCKISIPDCVGLVLFLLLASTPSTVYHLQLAETRKNDWNTQSCSGMSRAYVTRADHLTILCVGLTL